MMGAWIRDRRKKLMLSQSSLGSLVGASQAQVSAWERNKSKPSEALIARLVEFLGPVGPPGPVPLVAPFFSRERQWVARTSSPKLDPLAKGSLVCVAETRDGVAKLIGVEGDHAIVEYFDSVGSRIRRTVDADALVWITLPSHTRCYWLEAGHWKIGRVREHVLDGSGYQVVSQEGQSIVSERDLFVRWERPLADPTEVLAERGNESALDHSSRLAFVRSVLNQRAASRGLTGVLSAQVELHAHQVATARRVLEDPIPRYILADEVGLGKTIEAGFVIRQFLLDDPDGRVLVLVPPLLVNQWREELTSKFHVDDFPGACRVEAFSSNAWSTDGVGLLVIDEAHHFAAGATSDVAECRETYSRGRQVAAHSPKLLLLSATPLLHNEATFLAMLHLIDPSSYPLDDIATFRTRVAARASLGRVLLGFTENTPAFLLDEPAAELRALFPHDVRLTRLLAELDTSGNAPETESSAVVRAVRAHLAETHRISRRLLRTRRSDKLAETFPVRGRDGARVLPCADPERLAVDVWVDQWRQTVLLDAATEPDPTKRVANERDLAAVFGVLLPRACSSLQSLVAAVRYRARQGAEAENDANLTPSEAATLRQVPVCDAERMMLKRLEGELSEHGSDRRLQEIATILENRDRRKIVIFVSYLHAAVQIYTALVDRFGTDCVATHTAGMSAEEVDANVSKFRINNHCRVLVCDPTGEEGRNLQFADLLVLYDLSWAPNRLEQRLGRLDRYGRGTKVECVVLADTNEGITYHDRWCHSLATDFELFSRSVAAFQFAIDELMSRIWEALFQQGSDAFRVLSQQIRDVLSAEVRAISEQDVLDSVEASDRDIGLLNELEQCDANDASLRQDFERWLGCGAEDHAKLQVASRADTRNSRIVEYSPILPTQRGKQSIVPAYWLQRWFPSGKPVRATFGRVTSIRNLDTRLMRIGSPFYDEVHRFSECDDRGRAFAFWRYRNTLVECDLDWAFRFDYIIEGDPTPAIQLLADRSPSDGVARHSLQRRLDSLLPPFLTTVWVNAVGEAIVDEVRLRLLEEPYDKRAGDVNLRPSRFEFADRVLRIENWADACREARRRSEQWLRNSERFRTTLDACAAAADRSLGSRVDVLQARAERAAALCSEVLDAEQERRLAQALLAGVRAPRIRLETVGFVCLAGMPFPDEVPHA